MSRVRWRAIKIGSGTLGAQAISFVFLPIISRIYDPKEYGKLSIFLSTALILIPICTLKFDVILVVVKKDSIAKALLKIALINSIILSLILFPLVTYYFYKFEKMNLQNSNLNGLLFSMLLFFQSLTILLLQFSLRSHRDNSLVASSVLQNASISILQIGLGKIASKGELLVSGFIMGKVLGLLPLVRLLRSKNFDQRSDKVSLKSIFREYAKPAKQLIASGLLNSAALGLPIFVIGSIFGLNYSGHVGISQAILTVPITLIGGSIGSVLISEISKIRDENPQEAQGIIKQFLKPLIGASIIFTIVSMLLGARLVEYFLGSNWGDTSKLMFWLSIPFGIAFLWQPLSNLLFAEGNWKVFFLLSLAQFIFSSVFGFVSIFAGLNWLQTAVAFASGSAIAQLLGIYMVVKNFTSNNLNTKSFKLFN